MNLNKNNMYTYKWYAHIWLIEMCEVYFEKGHTKCTANFKNSKCFRICDFFFFFFLTKEWKDMLNNRSVTTWADNISESKKEWVSNNAYKGLLINNECLWYRRETDEITFWCN